MLFNSYMFIFGFLPPTVLVFFILGRWSQLSAMAWLTAASLFFYAWWSPYYLWLISASILFNYCSGLLIDLMQRRHRPRLARAALVAGISGNLALLGYYKYLNFFVANVNELTGLAWQVPHIILPLGISFFTFTQIAYLVDAARGEARERGFINYFLFVTYFPHLLAGPIIHHKAVMPQFRDPRTYLPSLDNFAIGLTIFTIGLAKKVLLADPLSLAAQPLFASGQAPLFVDAWYGTLAYTMQIYFDFSGYSDMAIGMSMLIGVRLPINFNSPYKATNIIEFWRRWHMTLSQFLRDYLYISLGGNRKGVARRYVNLYLTMLIGGLWHGAAWTFVIWGALHGIYLIINHAWRAAFPDLKQTALSTSIFWLATFCAVIVAWVFFRAPDLATAWNVLGGLAGANGLGDAAIKKDGLNILIFALLVALIAPNTQEITGYGGAVAKTTVSAGAQGLARVVRLANALRWRTTPAAGLIVGIVFFISLTKLRQVSEFIYYQF